MYLRTHTNPPVFLISSGVIAAFLLAGVLFTDATNTAASAALDFIATYFGWFYVLVATFFLIFVVGLMTSRYGKLRLGPDDSEPEYRTLPWFAMLSTAGMGIGLVFVGTVLAVAASILTILVVTLFFATSSDSGSLVVDMLTNGGDPHPIKPQRFFWAVTGGAVAAVLLVVGGATALGALQAASITAGLPFAVVLLLICAGLVRAMRQEPPPALLGGTRRGDDRGPAAEHQVPVR